MGGPAEVFRDAPGRQDQTAENPGERPARHVGSPPPGLASVGAAKQAIENDVHIVGASSLAGGHKTLVPQLIDELKAMGRDDIMVVAGGVIPKKDYDFLYKSGVTEVFGPGTVVSIAAHKILETLIKARS